MVSTAFLIVALILAILAALSVPVPYINLGWLAFAFFVAASVWPALMKG